jgi:SAM-dependent methyltransferase
MRNIDLETERDFENRKAKGEPVRKAQSKFYWATALPVIQHNASTCRRISGKTVLEIGCASGRDAIDYAKHASQYHGVDISDIAINNCQNLQVHNASFYCIDGHKLPVSDKSIDFVIVNSLLHHLDLPTVLQEISRILKPTGGLIFREPLGTNPIFNMYRLFTPNARTIDERPFTFADLKIIQSHFVFDDIQYFGFSSLIAAFIPNKFIRRILTAIDNLLAKTPLRFLYWQISGHATKR